MKRSRLTSACLLLVLLDCAVMRAAGPTPPAPAPPRAESSAAYELVVAKLLAAEGAVDEALEAFERAVELSGEGPDVAYILLEEAQLLARRAEQSRSRPARLADLTRAALRLAEARRLSADNLDVLRTAGAVQLDLAAAGAESALAKAREAFEAVVERNPADVEAAVSLGRIYLEQNEPGRAADVLQKLVEQLPRQRMAQSMLIEALLRAERWAEAEKAVVEILAFDPGSLEARLTLADLQDRRGDAMGAVGTLQSAPQEAKGDSRLQRQLAWGLYQTRELDLALPLANALVAREPEEVTHRLLRGLILVADGRSEAALTDLGQVASAQAKNVAFHLTVSRALERLGRQAEAAAGLLVASDRLAAAGLNAESRELRLEAARFYAGQKSWARVSEVLAPLAETDVEIRLQARLLAADALAGQGRVDEALAALAAEAPSTAVAAKQAEILLAAGRVAEGETALKALAAQTDVGARIAAAQVYQRLERDADALPILRDVTARQPELPVPAFLLAAALERSGRREEAIVELRRVIALAPDFDRALNYLAFIFAEAGEHLEEALGMVQRALVLDPDNGAYVDTLGWVHFRLGQHAKAVKALERAARLAPEDADVQEHLGDACAAAGQIEEARRAYRKAGELDPRRAAALSRKPAANLGVR